MTRNFERDYVVYVVDDNQEQEMTNQIKKELIIHIANPPFLNSIAVKCKNQIIDSKEAENENGILILVLNSKVDQTSPYYTQILLARKYSFAIIPVFYENENYTDLVPNIIRYIKAFKLKKDHSNIRELVSQNIFPELGLDEIQRKVFISYKWADGIEPASQLFKALSEKNYNVFLDTVRVREGQNIQFEIYKELEDKSFLLVLETKEAIKNPKWIAKEVQYALKHHIGVYIISYDCIDKKDHLLGTERFPRFILKSGEYEKAANTITPPMLELIVKEIETRHREALHRKKTYILGSIYNALESKGYEAENIDNWNITFRKTQANNEFSILSIVPRNPELLDLYRLFNLNSLIVNNNAEEKYLIHSSKKRDALHFQSLHWAIDNKNLHLNFLNDFLEIL